MGEERQAWMAILAKAPDKQLEACARTIAAAAPAVVMLRSPEIGLAMVRGRAGGTGQKFNLGEITVTRCVVQLESPDSDTPISGFGYVAGRSRRHAELAAICDALLQHPEWRDRVWHQVITPLQAEAEERRQQQQQQTEATRVKFFTMPRGS
ncbi:MAG: phosphonate C-P lyase system protein PhnG [Cyanobacteria bacterium J06648_11]